MHKSCGVPLRSISSNDPCSVRTFFSPSAARGVGQPDMLATCGNATATLRPSGIRPVALIPSQDCEPLLFPTVGVGHPASATQSFKSPLYLPGAFGSRLFPASLGALPLYRSALASPLFVASNANGVGHPVVPVSDVRRTDARRRKRDTPKGVTHAFHVSVYKVDPSICVLARNLLSKDDWRAALRDEVLPGGP